MNRNSLIFVQNSINSTLNSDLRSVWRFYTKNLSILYINILICLYKCPLFVEETGDHIVSTGLCLLVLTD